MNPRRGFVRIRIVLLLVAVLTTVGVGFVRRPIPRVRLSAISGVPHIHRPTRYQRPATVHRESGPFIDGAETPELIPDDVAYSLFFRMLLPRDGSVSALRRQRSYVRHVLRVGAAMESGQTHSDEAPSEADITSTLRFIAGYEPRLRALDQRQGTRAEETLLVSELISSMHAELSKALATHVEAYVNKQFKRGVKIVL